MKILITNDDGVFAPALPGLVAWAQKLGEVTVVAPKIEQSGKSHAIDFTHPLEIKQVEIAPGMTAWSVDSTPADCVRFALDYLGGGFDLLLSGINRGYNLGADIVYSGTIGAIYEGSRQALPGIALSAYPADHLQAVKHLDAIFAFWKEHELSRRGLLYNINIPPTPQGIRITRQGGIYFTDRFIPIGDDLFVQEGEPLLENLTDLSVDIAAVHGNLISVTPLSPCRTDMALFEELKGIRSQGV